jgi:hypothetical protein
MVLDHKSLSAYSLHSRADDDENNRKPPSIDYLPAPQQPRLTHKFPDKNLNPERIVPFGNFVAAVLIHQPLFCRA